MLTQRDRQALADNEERLRGSEPGFARRREFPHGSTAGHRIRLGRIVGPMALVLGLLMLATGLTERDADLSLLSVVLLAATAVSWAGHRLLLRLRRRRARVSRQAG